MTEDNWQQTSVDHVPWQLLLGRLVALGAFADRTPLHGRNPLEKTISDIKIKMKIIADMLHIYLTIYLFYSNAEKIDEK